MPFTINADGLKVTGTATGVAGQAIEFNWGVIGRKLGILLSDDLNAYVTSGNGTVEDPFILDTAAIAALPSNITLNARPAQHYAFASTVGFSIPANKSFITIDGNGSTLWNRGTGEAAALISVGNYDGSGSPVASDTNCNFNVTFRDWIIDGGTNGATVAMRITSAHYCRFENITLRNYKTIGVLNRGGVHTTYAFINGGYDPTGTWTPSFTPQNGFILDGAPSVSFGQFPGSTISLFHVEIKGHSKDGLRVLNAFNTAVDSSAFEAVVQGPLFTGSTSDWDAMEAYCRGNNGAGIYIGPNAYSTHIRCTDPEYSAELPTGGGYKMGIVVDSGSRGTLIDASAMFNSRIVVAKDAAQVEVRAGGNQIGVVANGSGVRLSGMPAVSSVTKGPSLSNFYNEVAVYSDSFKLDEAPPQSVGGFVVGYDPYNNPGPVRTISFSCLFHKDLVGGGYPNYALAQESNGVTRLNGTQVWIGVGDAANIIIQTGKLGFFGATAVARPTLSAAATDAASTQTLANSLRTALINLGLCS